MDECSLSTVDMTRDLLHRLPGESWWLLMVADEILQVSPQVATGFFKPERKRLARPLNFLQTSSIINLRV